ncbi:hypothetical protein [Frigoribacterium sp. UYMn621]|uniref:hypothetical protein n=1 Tax=Frigoribacterium sp. UYMn621 TaxID=3156343 RepID=UPI0033939E48
MNAAYIHETPFGRVAVRVRATGGAYIEPAHGLDSRGFPITGFINGNGTAESPTLAVITVNGHRYHAGFTLKVNANYGHVNSETGKRNERTHVLHVSNFEDFSSSARLKLAAHFEANLSTYATPERIAEARLGDANDELQKATEGLEKAQEALVKAETAERLAIAEAAAALEYVTRANHQIGR